jgi:hypothetical protein
MARETLKNQSDVTFWHRFLFQFSQKKRNFARLKLNMP